VRMSLPSTHERWWLSKIRDLGTGQQIPGATSALQLALSLQCHARSRGIFLRLSPHCLVLHKRNACANEALDTLKQPKADDKA